MEPYLDPTRHPSDETLEFYSLGRLEEPELEQVETHLLACAHCQDLVVDNDAYLPALKSVLAETLPQPVPHGVGAWWKGWIPQVPAFAGAIAAAVLGIVLLRPAGELPAPLSVTLHSERSGGLVDTAAKAPANAPLDLRIVSSSLTVSAQDRLVIVDGAGQRAWEGGFDATVAHLRQGLPAGTYWVRLYDAQQQLLQEYGLQLN